MGHLVTDELHQLVAEPATGPSLDGTDGGHQYAIGPGAGPQFHLGEEVAIGEQLAYGSDPSAQSARRTARAAGELERSISSLPPDAQPYFERVLRIAQLAITPGRDAGVGDTSLLVPEPEERMSPEHFSQLTC